MGYFNSSSISVLPRWFTLFATVCIPFISNIFSSRQNLIISLATVVLSPISLSKIELCNKIKCHLPDFHIFESNMAKDPDKRDYIVSNNKIEATGWKPEFTLDNGIIELIKLYSYLKINNYHNA